MKRCRLIFLTLMLVGLSGISPSDGQSTGQVPAVGPPRSQEATTRSHRTPQSQTLPRQVQGSKCTAPSMPTLSPSTSRM